MSSATVLFVIKSILEQAPEPGDERICSMAFGPGLTVETALFTKLRQAPRPVPEEHNGQERLAVEVPVA
jgi:hypothetical protein